VRSQLACEQDSAAGDRLRQRLSHLIYGSAVLWVGANTPLALEARQATARRTVTATRGAMRAGVVPGGGVALWNLRPVLQARLCAARSVEERLAYKILLHALEAPIRTLLANAGCEPETVLAELAHQPAGHGFDVLRGACADMAAAGIVDSAAVVRTALQHAVQSAALALTIDVLVQRANPPLGIQQT
jgi:chaperonin GroEL